MKPAPFQYYAPRTIADATDLLAAVGAEGKILAGGQSLVPMLNMRLTRFDSLIDITRIPELHHIEIGPSSVRIGAGVRDHEIEDSAAVGEAIPLLREATGHIGHFQIRSQGTLCGSIAHADPAAEYPCVALTLDAEMEITGPSGTRREPAGRFFAGTWQTTLAEDELLLAVHFPRWPPGAGFAVEEVARREGDFAIAGAAVAVALQGGTVSRVAIGLFGLASTPVRASAAEAALVGLARTAVDPREIARIATEDLDPPGDLHASGALRTRIGAAVVRRAVTRALGNTGEESSS